MLNNEEPRGILPMVTLAEFICRLIHRMWKRLPKAVQVGLVVLTLWISPVSGFEKAYRKMCYTMPPRTAVGKRFAASPAIGRLKAAHEQGLKLL